MRTNPFFRNLAVCLFLVLAIPGLTLAGIRPPVADRGPELAGIAPVAIEAQGKDLFFNALDPRNSAKGVVKSFNVRVAERKPRTAAPRGTLLVQKFPEYKAGGPIGRLMVPVSGKISSYFGNRRHPYRNVLRHFHTGIDIPAQPGTPIRVSAPGRVIYSGWRQGYGLMVEVDHGNGLSTVYAHCSKLSVRLGDTIGTGSQVGQVGRTGVTTGPHLHFEVRRRGSVLDPMGFLR